MEYSGKKNIDELKCVWMSTNFVGEKLCNNNFDCDSCSFDREIRKSRYHKELCDSIFQYSEQNILEDVIHKLIKLKSISYPPQYFFSSCFITKKFLGDTYFLGLSPVLNILLDGEYEFNISGQVQVYKKGDKFINITGDWGNVDVNAPFDFSVESEVLPLTSKSENGKWLGFIKSANGNFGNIGSGTDNYIKSIESVCSNLRKYIKKYVTVGATMYDGGERLKFIYQVIGKENYLKILLQILS